MYPTKQLHRPDELDHKKRLGSHPHGAAPPPAAVQNRAREGHPTKTKRETEKSDGKQNHSYEKREVTSAEHARREDVLHS